jgi:curved DNA-binding protein CbpA
MAHIFKKGFLKGLQISADDIQRAFQQGREEGIAVGYDRGYDTGFGRGHDEGLAKGIKQGYLQGVEKGLIEGLNEGYRKAVEDAYEKARNEPKFDRHRNSGATFGKAQQIRKNMRKKQQLPPPGELNEAMREQIANWARVRSLFDLLAEINPELPALSIQSSTEDINKAFRVASKKIHPDKHHEFQEYYAEVFKAIRSKYEEMIH